MLRGLEFDGLVVRDTLVQGGDEILHVAMATQLSEAVLGLAERAGNPSKGHLPIAPALDVARVVRDRAVEVLDRVGRAQRAVQRGDVPAVVATRGGGMNHLTRPSSLAV